MADIGFKGRPTDSSGRNGSVRGHAVEELLRRSANRGYAELLDELRAFAPQSDTDDMAEEDIARSGRDRVSSVSARLARSVESVLSSANPATAQALMSAIPKPKPASI